jgi:hypothetical protein
LRENIFAFQKTGYFRPIFRKWYSLALFPIQYGIGINPHARSCLLLRQSFEHPLVAELFTERCLFGKYGAWLGGFQGNLGEL